jgi:hypothetical protein
MASSGSETAMDGARLSNGGLAIALLRSVRLARAGRPNGEVAQKWDCEQPRAARAHARGLGPWLVASDSASFGDSPERAEPEPYRTL